MSFVTELVCAKCQTKYPPDTNPIFCTRDDSGRLDLHYDYAAIRGQLERNPLGKRGARDIWRYWEFMPVDPRFAVRLGEGGTPLIKARRLGAKLGLSNLYLKDETRNPTASFKDRAMAVGVAKAREIQATTVVTASSGNAAASLAAYSAKAGLGCHAFVLDTASPAKVAQLTLYGAYVVKVRGLERGVDPTIPLMIAAAKTRRWYPCPSFGPFNPYQVEGPKTIAYELAEQIGFQPIDWLLIPTGSTCLLTGVWKGFNDLHETDLYPSAPRLVPVQPAGNAAFTRACQHHLDFPQIQPEPHPDTLAAGLSDPYPWDGDAGLRAVRETRGVAVPAPDATILQAVRDLAKLEGVFAEPSGAASVAGLYALVEDGHLDSSETVVVLVTGAGLKAPDIVLRRGGSRLARV